MTAPAAIVCAGEALIDRLRRDGDTKRSHAGGPTWNVARALAALGAASGFAGTISCCVAGDALWRASEAEGLDLRYLQRAGMPHDDQADLLFDPTNMPSGWQQEVQWLHVGSISLARGPLDLTLIGLAEQAKAHGLRISYDPHWHDLMGPAYDATLRRMSELADVIKVADDDLRALFRSHDTLGSLGRLRARNPAALVLLTRRDGGASLYHSAQTWHAKAPVLDVVDTLGAGDAGMAGLIYSLQQWPEAGMDAHLAFAVAAGGAACRVGWTQAPSLGAVRALLGKVTVTR
ncbi:fructokinase [Massilia sp. MP_M2]|uniref:PfkB family carbohydrate kinase n=1 Tax=Massilia sp. MP_M2 TaxID=3071713 RepID=UPI00319D934F